MYKLVVVHKGKIQRNVPLRHESIIIGRKEESDIHLEQKQVSGRHAEVLLKNNNVIIRDLGSTNGTAVNGEPVSEKKLLTGDQITIGDYKLIFVTEHGDEEDPDATVMVSSNRIRPEVTPATEKSSSNHTIKIIALIVVVLLLALWFTNVI